MTFSIPHLPPHHNSSPGCLIPQAPSTMTLSPHSWVQGGGTWVPSMAGAPSTLSPGLFLGEGVQGQRSKQ